MSLSEKSRTILASIARGCSYDQIVASIPDCTYKDIFDAAQQALNLAETGRDPAAYEESINKIKAVHPRAYFGWSSEEETQLRMLHGKGMTPKEVAVELQRQPGAIKSRLRRLGLLK